jgi:hypothetical protein
MVPWRIWFENWESQIVVSGPRPLSKGAGSRNNLLFVVSIDGAMVAVVLVQPWFHGAFGSRTGRVR